MKIRSACAELLHADGQTGGRTNTTMKIAAFRSLGTCLKKGGGPAIEH
jgi:hypothetical protein